MGRSTLIDLTGQRFGRLVVLHRVENSPSGATRWLCRCDCGNEKITTTHLLRGGHTKSCGCLHAEMIRRTKTKDMTGQRFGMLTVLRMDDERHENGRAHWICRCDCGNEVSVSGKNLRKGHTQTCGCKSREIAAEKYRKDLTGKRVGKLTALRPGINPRTGKSAWLCKCDCGNEVYVSMENFREGGQISCGCARFDIGRYNIEHKTTHGASSKTGSHSEDHRLYSVWLGIRERCNKPSSSSYKYYGGRGIKICDEWNNSFEAFRDWAYSTGYDRVAPTHACTIDRIDVNGDYCPENCRWATAKQQSNNKRNNKFFTIGSETHTMAEWCEIRNVSKRLVKDRVSRGWDIERALSEPPRRINRA